MYQFLDFHNQEIKWGTRISEKERREEIQWRKEKKKEFKLKGKAEKKNRN